MRVVTSATVVLLIVMLAMTVTGQTAVGQIVRIGRQLEPSAIGIDLPGYTFLMNDTALEDGIIFAFSAYFRAQTPTRFQVWRPVQEQTANVNFQLFKLMWELRVLPAVVQQRQDIYVLNQQQQQTQCFHIRKDDRIGIFNEEAPASVAYVFNPTEPDALNSHLTNISIPNSVGDTVQFDTLRYPYAFSLAAYVDTNDGAYANDTSDWVNCPTKTVIPDTIQNVTTPATAVVVGPPGATGWTGPSGPAGQQGPPGPPGPPGNDASGNNATVQAGSSQGVGAGQSGSNGMVTGLLVWLIILTIVVILLAILAVLAWFRFRKRQRDLERLIMSSNVAENRQHTVLTGTPAKLSLAHAPSNKSDRVWMSDMKEEVESQYSVDTLKERTPLSKTGPFVYSNEEFEADQNENIQHNGESSGGRRVVGEY